MRKKSLLAYMALALFGALAIYLAEASPKAPAAYSKAKPAHDNDWIISESRKCSEAGMYPEQWLNIFTNRVDRIQCIPRGEPNHNNN